MKSKPPRARPADRGCGRRSPRILGSRSLMFRGVKTRGKQTAVDVVGRGVLEDDRSGGQLDVALDESRGRCPCRRCRSPSRLEHGIDVVEAADGVEVVALVVVQRAARPGAVARSGTGPSRSRSRTGRSRCRIPSWSSRSPSLAVVGRSRWSGGSDHRVSRTAAPAHCASLRGLADSAAGTSMAQKKEERSHRSAGSRPGPSPPRRPGRPGGPRLGVHPAPGPARPLEGRRHHRAGLGPSGPRPCPTPVPVGVSPSPVLDADLVEPVRRQASPITGAGGRRWRRSRKQRYSHKNVGSFSSGRDQGSGAMAKRALSIPAVRCGQPPVRDP